MTESTKKLLALVAMGILLVAVVLGALVPDARDFMTKIATGILGALPMFFGAQ